MYKFVNRIRSADNNDMLAVSMYIYHAFAYKNTEYIIQNINHRTLSM